MAVNVRVNTHTKTIFMMIMFLIALVVAIYNHQIGANLNKTFRNNEMLECQKLAYNDCQNLIAELNSPFN